MYDADWHRRIESQWPWLFKSCSFSYFWLHPQTEHFLDCYFIPQDKPQTLHHHISCKDIRLPCISFTLSCRNCRKVEGLTCQRSLSLGILMKLQISPASIIPTTILTWLSDWDKTYFLKGLHWRRFLSDGEMVTLQKFAVLKLAPWSMVPIGVNTALDTSPCPGSQVLQLYRQDCLNPNQNFESAHVTVAQVTHSCRDSLALVKRTSCSWHPWSFKHV